MIITLLSMIFDVINLEFIWSLPNWIRKNVVRFLSIGKNHYW